MNSTPLELRLSPSWLFEAKANPEGVIEGLASAFGGEPDSYGDVIAPGAFAASLARHRTAQSAPVMLWAHDPARVIGRWSELRETSAGLAVTGRLNLATDAGRDAFEHVRAGDLNGLSIGFVAKDSRREGALRVLTECDLHEISVVAMPANTRARITEAKQLGSKAALRDLLLTTGLPRAAADRVAAGGWPALSKAPADDIDPTDAALIVRELRALGARIARAPAD